MRAYTVPRTPAPGGKKSTMASPWFGGDGDVGSGRQAGRSGRHVSPVLSPPMGGGSMLSHRGGGGGGGGGRSVYGDTSSIHGGGHGGYGVGAGSRSVRTSSVSYAKSRTSHWQSGAASRMADRLSPVRSNPAADMVHASDLPPRESLYDSDDSFTGKSGRRSASPVTPMRGSKDAVTATPITTPAVRAGGWDDHAVDSMIAPRVASRVFDEPEDAAPSRPVGGGETSTWITIFGFPAGDEERILLYFQRFGDVFNRDIRLSPSNWLHIQYSSSDAASAALQHMKYARGDIIPGHMIGAQPCIDQSVLSGSRSQSDTRTPTSSRKKRARETSHRVIDASSRFDSESIFQEKRPRASQYSWCSKLRQFLFNC